MRKREIAKKAAYIGAGVGLALFALIGFLPGSFLGGVIGLNIAGSLFGTPVTSTLLTRLIVGVSMLLGIMVSCLIFVVGLTTLGWLIGNAIDAIRVGKAEPVEAKH